MKNLIIPEGKVSLSEQAENYINGADFAFIRCPNSIGVCYCAKANKNIGKFSPDSIRGKLVDTLVYGQADTIGKSVIINMRGEVSTANFEVRQPSLQSPIERLESALLRYNDTINRLENERYPLDERGRTRLSRLRADRNETQYALNLLRVQESTDKHSLPLKKEKGWR